MCGFLSLSLSCRQRLRLVSSRMFLQTSQSCGVLHCRLTCKLHACSPAAAEANLLQHGCSRNAFNAELHKAVTEHWAHMHRMRDGYKKRSTLKLAV
jgi:hypothetical protein